ncbi:hypothetical protein [Ligilactobacillus salivarius]|uniref:hypothetical protein n=1 Tax=Ligilactobacillus salivarius TaxID=1624 RepID=UPI00136C76B2|nr:hypothetical protein [Ligilactobacillus salivarius]MYV10638.1 hypothetical protein [Ligilactobacillus salivarius]
MSFWKRVNNNLEIALGIFGAIVLLFGVGSLIWAAICALPEFLIALGIVTGGCLLGFVATYLIAIIVTLISDKNKYKDEYFYEDRDYENEDEDE